MHLLTFFYSIIYNLNEKRDMCKQHLNSKINSLYLLNLDALHGSSFKKTLKKKKRVVVPCFELLTIFYSII